jgi:hypothetical protein
MVSKSFRPAKKIYQLFCRRWKIPEPHFRLYDFQFSEAKLVLVVPKDINPCIGG